MSRSLLSLPVSERPRERLMRDGVDGLSLSELLAIVLGSGTQGNCVLTVAEELLTRFGSLERLLEASLVELMEIKGIGRAKAIQLKAVFGIALRSKRSWNVDKFPITNPQEAAVLAQSEIAHYKQEVLLVILRDAKGCLIQREQVSVGTLSEVLVHPREVFYPAVRHKAHTIILAHNHPSGDPTPSAADLTLTRALIQASQLMGIGLTDHLIVCPHRYVSLREKGFLGNSIFY